MKDFKVISNDRDCTFHFPTTVNEIDDDYLVELSKQINVCAHHCLIGLLCRDSLFNIVTTLKQKKNTVTTGVTPIFIKHGETDSEFIKSLTLKDRLVIPTSMLALAYHVNSPQNVLSLDYFCNKAKEDTSIGMRAAAEKDKVFFVDLKIIQNTSIIGAYTTYNIGSDAIEEYFSIDKINLIEGR